MLTFESDNFDIVEYLGRDSVYDLDKVEEYLDFAINSTIKKQIPNIDYNTEKRYAKKILTDYLNGNDNIFTRQNNVRSNIIQIGRNRINNLLIKIAIEKKAFNNRVRRTLVDENLADKCVTKITELIQTGHYKMAVDILNNEVVRESIINTYIDSFYGQSIERIKDIECIVYDDNNLSRVLETLNIDIISNSKTR